MRMVDLITKKRDGGTLSKDEIVFFVQGYTKGDIPDYQASAFLMTIYFNGMTEEETAWLTEEMAISGETFDLSSIEGKKVDKHSTGGVGDKITLITGPLVAAIGIPVAKMSGRGLGHTGGTLDKLESFQGFSIDLSREQFMGLVNENKLAVAGQTGNLAPADKKLYALRDVTGTVNTIPLIASSIMSKKLASGAEAIVLDVKTGSGAFMKSLDESKKLAETMVKIGKNLGRQTVAVITDMNQPLGFEIGNSNEVKEAIQVLSGEKITDLREISVELATHMALLADKFSSYEEARANLEESLDNGTALAAFRTFIGAQGGDTALVDDPELLPQADYHIEVKAPAAGYVHSIDAEGIGTAAMYLGAGRATKDDDIDHAVGITLKKKQGDAVAQGETIAILHARDAQAADSVNKVLASYTIDAALPEKMQLIYDVIS
ncbi:pyrimidine-nucleoside phosphorylase [Terribacillus halophilus]|uniref:Pyrimidine-nucleoside phosphorylase n=1 Tax=Terribacillus halophilus TaxID=361279 RepID=A0A1G6UVZ0_9BACI|nr:pyrimidine-nucleoside phosphorylase [Terribacillus halophilus]SDD45529.1 pyrimidine-nucleoside phosphorylase [Terribacillus halophilus]